MNRRERTAHLRRARALLRILDAVERMMIDALLIERAVWDAVGAPRRARKRRR